MTAFGRGTGAAKLKHTHFFSYMQRLSGWAGESKDFDQRGDMIHFYLEAITLLFWEQNEAQGGEGYLPVLFTAELLVLGAMPGTHRDKCSIDICSMNE